MLAASDDQKVQAAAIFPHCTTTVPVILGWIVQ